jgi:hypothetical protein
LVLLEKAKGQSTGDSEMGFLLAQTGNEQPADQTSR